MASGNYIGIDRDEYRNVVSANKINGISTMENSFGNLIEGNYVGTDITGMKGIGNDSHGITFELAGYGSIVRNNVSCSNGRVGIQVGDNMGNFNVIIGNYVGIGADGKTGIPNHSCSICLVGGIGGSCSYNVIGGRDTYNQNILFIDERNGPPGLVFGVYDTIVDGIVYKYKQENIY